MSGAARDHFIDAYASGALGAGLSLLVETQALIVPDVGARVRAAETVAGVFLELETPAALHEEALAHVLARIEANASAPESGGPTRAFMAEVTRLPAPVRAAAFEALRARDWAFGGPGLRILDLKLADEARVELIRIEPGFAAPRHTHAGEEYTLVLTGAYHDGIARYGVGDIARAGPDIVHRPRAEEGEVCYNLAVSEGPLLFTGLMGAAQKLWLT